MLRPASLAIALLCAGCHRSAPVEGGPLRIAAAADLAGAFTEAGAAFQRRTGRHVVFSFGSSGLLAKQIDEGAPFDAFAAANTAYVDEVVRAGRCRADSRALYGRGQLVIWWRRDSPVVAPRSLEDLADARFRRVAIANPQHAPYGIAAQQALAAAGILDGLRPRLVFGENVQQALQFAQSGNAEVAIVAGSLAESAGGRTLPVPAERHAPLDQALVACGPRAAEGRRFDDFVLSDEGRAILRRHGFGLPGDAR